MSDTDTLKYFFLYDIKVVTKNIFNMRSDSSIIYGNVWFY